MIEEHWEFSDRLVIVVVGTLGGVIVGVRNTTDITVNFYMVQTGRL
jgi:hypothetical protein